MAKQSSKSAKISPVRQQYLDIKGQHRDAIVFFRLGDFYETFDEDAEVVARELDIVLTSRNVAKGVRVPMAGIPHHAAENYLSRLIEKGFHVAICEQVGTEPVNGLMPREVVRIVTPGTIVEPGLLPGDGNNYLVALVLGDEHAGVAYADITTGEFAATEFAGNGLSNAVRAEINRLHPAELLIPDSLAIDDSENGLPGFQTEWPSWRFEPGRCEDALKQHFEVASLDGYGLKGHSWAIRAAGGILQYLRDTQPSALSLLTGINYYSLNEFMVLDANTRRNLELTETIRGGRVKGSLLGVLDLTVTPMGGRLLRQWVSRPLLDIDAIKTRQGAVATFFEDGLLRAEVRTALKPLNDLERLTNRVIGGSAIPRDLVAMRETLEHLPALQGLLPQDQAGIADTLKRFNLCEDPLALLHHALAAEPPATLQNTGVIRSGYSEELDGVVEASRFAREWISNLETVERERLGIKSLKVGYNKVHGYYIEITKSNSHLAPEDYIRKQTLVNAERYITPEMKDYESQVLNAEERIHEIELRLFKELCLQLSASADALLETARVIGEIDVLTTLAEVAAVEGYVCPEVVSEDILDVVDSRHPVVEHTLRGGERFVPNDVIFGQGERIRIITGPNMSGKSTYLRQVALIALLAQMGSYVPADEATIGLVDRIFTRIGAQDEIHSGQSTFMVEMVETANILNHATERSLLVLDEIGRGTSTYDGVSIAWAVVEYIHNHPDIRAKTLFATHYHELTQLSELLPGVHNYNVAVSEADGKVVFLHKIIPGGADRSYGIHVGQLAGLPKPVVQRAQEILQQLEASSGTAVKINPEAAKQIALFPETNPLVDELKKIDINALSPMDALNKLYEWQKKFAENSEDE
jgi:DNA mismatch repair protein MutS